MARIPLRYAWLMLGFLAVPAFAYATGPVFGDLWARAARVSAALREGRAAAADAGEGRVVARLEVEGRRFEVRVGSGEPGASPRLWSVAYSVEQ